MSRFGFTSDTADTDSLVRHVIALGGSLLRYRHIGPGISEVVVTDPDGNVISL